MGRFAGTASYVFGQPMSDVSGYVTLSIDALAEKTVPHCFVLKWQQGKFSEVAKEGWLPAGMAKCTVDDSLVIVGNFGMSVEINDAGVIRDLSLDLRLPDNRKIRSRGPLRCVRRIGDHVYAVGGDRQAFRRERAGEWTSIDDSARPDFEDTTIFGFESIDGFAENDIYAAGWKGEIWHFDGSMWRLQPSPTNILLTTVCCGADGYVYIAGREGLLLCGRNNHWDIVDTGDIRADFWSATWFDGFLYLSGMQGLYRLMNGQLEFVDPGLGPTSFNTLAVEGNEMWSIGATDIVAFDGVQWRRID